MVLLLSVLLKTVAETYLARFWDAVRHFVDMDSFRDGLSLLSWAVYFPPPSQDETEVAVRVFAVMSGMVGLSDPTPPCPRCGSATEFVADASEAFGWRYRCSRASRLVSRAEARKRRLKSTRECTGSVSATTNTWFTDCRSVYRTLSLLFCWLARQTVSAAAAAAKCSSSTAVDHFSMAREVCEVVMSNELLNHQFGGPGKEVEVDECFLTRRKYHKGANFFSWCNVWATVCKTVRPMLSVRCLSCLSVTSVYCAQTVERINMKVGMPVGLGPGHIVLRRDAAPPPVKGHSPLTNFRPISVTAKCVHGTFVLIFLCGECHPTLSWPNGWMDEDATWYGSRHRRGPQCLSLIHI